LSFDVSSDLRTFPGRWLCRIIRWRRVDLVFDPQHVTKRDGLGVRVPRWLWVVSALEAVDMFR